MYSTMVNLIGNIVVMCLPYADQPHSYELMVESLTGFFTLWFMAEVLLKLLGLGWADFWASKWNIFDASLIAVSVIDETVTFIRESGASGGESSGGNLMYLRILRMVRVVRMIRLMRYWEGLFRIMTCLVSAGRQLLNIFIILFVESFPI